MKFTISNCQLEGCCNFLVQYNKHKRICGNHQKSNGVVFNELRNPTIIKKPFKYTPKKTKTRTIKECKLIEQLCHADVIDYEKAPVQLIT